MEIAKEYKKIISWLEKYKAKTNCKGVVLGLSGGKDSTTVAMLAKKVWGDKVVAVLMPNGQQNDISDSITIANTLKLKYYIINIGSPYKALIDEIKTNVKAVAHDLNGNELSAYSEQCPPVSDKAKTNIPPRLRMTVLYAVAQTLDYRVIGTGNKSEAYIGWTTKWGDSAHDFNPIAHLTCSKVMELGKYLAKDFNLDEKFVTKTPSDGLC
ncbi:MAG: NAD(+) synthase, partial [Clostridia bacterium]|nr:NAD(+) synthase [Clostridia bacterium]